MRNVVSLVFLLLLVAACGGRLQSESDDTLGPLGSYQHLPGFFDLYWDQSKGRLIVRIDEFDTPFLYQSSLARGIGSNDLGLDRGQLGATKVVEFHRSGPKILLIEDNLDYRAMSDDVDETNAVAESFARSVIWGFEMIGERDGSVFVDATEFMLRDSHSVAARLARMEEGDFKPDPVRSAIYMANTRSFPDNSEVEAIVTFTGQASGEFLPTVTPDSQTITVHLHHSLIRLPDDDYEPLPLEPRSGFFGAGFQDYASQVGDVLNVSYGRRHRLEKVDPGAAVSEAVEPIVYYVDRGAPEPIRSALIEGASWWNQAFEAAGYKDAFRVELMPEGADPMDVRYNFIQWVHRSTRGWSYGGGITDPRTGEIMKGKVTLGSLRVRQDYLIAEGLLAPYDDEARPDEMLRMSLARIRQLSAHEVGHTLGLTHNMAASTQNRASVMDYPHPLVRFDEDGNIDLGDAYGIGIGDWDKRAILYGYQDFPDGTVVSTARDNIMAETIDSGLIFVSDPDSRAIGSAHPAGNLWDNGADSIEELNHLLRVREYALSRFTENNIRPGRPLATLEEVLVPLYLLHRHQLIAVGKNLGGHTFTYAMRGDGQDLARPVPADRQRAAMDALLHTLDPSVLRIPENILQLIPPRPLGYPKSRESFPTSTGKVFEQIGAAQSAATLTLQVLLEPTRAARMVSSSARNATPGFADLTSNLLEKTWLATQRPGIEGEIQIAVNNLVLEHLMMLTVNVEADTQVRALALDAITSLDEILASRVNREGDRTWRAHFEFARHRIERMRTDPSSVAEIVPVTTPPGEPI
jgi:hypothetical protein